ncbi:MAG: cell division protein FtsQ/DivIB [Alphaproteobacteria bacterium]|nr:cell division protein FtsQ/DivIB [Alphaproteobacteria bacterium]
MRALINKWIGNWPGIGARQMGGAEDLGVVLPRVLRRPMRFLTALVDGRIVVPRHMGAVAALSLFAATGLYGVFAGGHFKALMEVTTSSAGFAVERVDVAGNQETSPIDVVEQLGLDGGTSVITMDVDSARDAILSLPWVADAKVRKVYPDVVDVKLSERRAFAIWQHGRELSLIEQNGSVIAPFENHRFSTLPLFVGLGADTHAAEFDRLLAGWPDLKHRIKASIRVADRRWDVRLENGITVNLPEKNAGAALAKLSKIQSEQALLDRDIQTVDLRLDDRITVGLTERALERRNTAIEERTRMLKKRGRNS